MATPTTTPTNPPRSYFGVWQRLLRGYGPLAVFALLLVAMAVFVPTKTPEDVDAGGFGGGNASDDSGGGGGNSGFQTGDGGPRDNTSTTAGGSGGPGTTAGGGGQTGGPNDPGDGVPAGPGVSTCPGGDFQVPSDEYSPPCIEFTGDNGGATHRGVTADTISVAYRALNERGFQQTLAELAQAQLSDSPEAVRNTVEALADYFSQNFQFYGRSIDIEFYDGVGSNTSELVGKGRAQAEADAQTVGGMDVFADLSATSEPYANALCNKGVLAFGTPYLSRKWHDDRGPCAWSLAVNGTEVAEFAAEFAAKRLAGGTADRGGAGVQGRPRVIATLAPNNPWYQESVEVSRARYEELSGLPAGPNYQYLLDLGQLSNQASELIPRMKADGVTTIICGCDPILPVFLSSAAVREDYAPEFIIAGTALTDADIVGQLWHEDFAAHAFGVSPLTSFTDPTSTLAYQAFKSVRPDEEPAFTVDLIYYQMYQLAIGIQMAGPNLTPETFQQGMYEYPARSGTFGLWDFGPGDHTSADDVREIYWDSTVVSPYNGRPGGYVGINGDARYRRDELPSGPFEAPLVTG